MPKKTSVCLLIMLSLTLSGCSIQGLMGKKQNSATQTAPSDKKESIAVALDEKDPNMPLLLRGLQDMAKKDETKLEILTAGAQQGQNAAQGSGSAEQSAQGQNNSSKKSQSGNKQAESPLKGAKMLIYQGGKPEVLQSALKDNIPILAIGELPTGVKASGVIVADPDQSGVLMAEAVLRKVTEGQVVYLQGDPGDSVAQETVASFKRAVQKNSKIMLHLMLNPSGSETVAKHNLQEYLQKNPDKVQAVCAQNEKLATQAQEALKSLQLEKKVSLIGGQANIQSLQRIAAGTQIADIDTAPYIQGVNAYQWAMKIMKKEALDISESLTGEQGEVPAKIVPVKIVTAENLNVTQKSYAKTMEAQKQAEAGKQEENAKKSGGSQSGAMKQAEASQSKGSADGTGSGGEAKKSSNVPQGAVKVNERVRTEITREYLDAQGKVIGTEKSANDQARTIPPEMLQQEVQKQKPEESGQGKDGSQESKKTAKDGESKKEQ